MDKIERIRAFVTVVDAGSFTAAADRLRISNKLVSKYVASLESDLGVTLLHRTTRALSLTAAGERYLDGARRLLRLADELDSQLLAGDTALSGRLRITAPMTFGEMFIAELSHDFLRKHPRVSIDLNLTDRYVDLAAEGFDIAIRIGNLRDSSLMGRRLGRTQSWLVASPDYLARHPKPQSPADLKGHRAIRDTNDASLNRAAFILDGAPVSIALNSRIAVNSAEAVRRLALAGEGLAFTPRFVVEADVAAGRLIRLLADYETPPLDIQALQLPQPFALPRVSAYLDHLREVLRPQLMPEPPQGS
ncbi:LysR family transcriptional regulator [Paracoccus sp. (in: a-proteobacteria)]|uniref:LysR family transcriptional regulator n=1 Tax=Paracoccus sp. TaxID=267 RepID=UPI002896C571|nr:LysR family transcriptional regulator [Paracoccus sp. (in: a-proteobacteria)]